VTDLVVVGAGTMGAWTALHAVRAGRSVLLVDAYGIGHPRSTSGDETRIIRSSHGADAFYTGWARQAREAWQGLAQESGERLFVEAGALWFAHRENGFETASESTLHDADVPVEHLTPDEVRARWPQVAVDDLAFAVFEPEGGLLMARRGVAAAAAAFARDGGEFQLASVAPGRITDGRLLDVVAQDGRRLAADQFVFACGPWLPRLFPEVLGDLIRVTKQDVLFVGQPAGDDRFGADRMPAWVDYDAAFYGIPAVDGRGPKVAPDRYGPVFDPSHGDRLVDPETVRLTRQFLARRLPALAEQPIVETRVCQYETTPDTNFVIDRHPDLENVWLVGGGSGHGFKHGPMIGRYVVDRLDGLPTRPDDERFAIDRPRLPTAGMRTGGDSIVASWEGY
jgi:glycine/D-amino acid oxidase-like deaminating enzyme